MLRTRSSVCFCINLLSPKWFSSNSKARDYIYNCNTQITKFAKNGDMSKAESIFNSMHVKNVITWTAMLSAYAGSGQISKARQVFDEMPERSVQSWNAMITACVRNKVGVDETYELFMQMPERNAVSYAVMVTGFVQAGRLDMADELYDEMPVEWRDPVCSNALISGYVKVGRVGEAERVFEGMREKDVVSWSSMLDGYCKDGRIWEAWELFCRMPERNVVSWTAMINGYLKMGSFEDGFNLFLQMRGEDSVKVNFNTLTILFDACGRLDRFVEACQLHGLALQMGFGSDVFLGNSIITMYCRFSCVDSASMIFETMDKRDIVSWNSLISGFVQVENIDKAYALFQSMPEKDVVSWTTMISGLSNKGLVSEAIELFEMMPYQKDDFAWTALISGFANNRNHEQAIYWFMQMLWNAVRPNPLTLSSVLSSSAGLAILHRGQQLHAHVVKMDMELDLSVQNSLVSMYSKCGNLHEANRIFRSIISPNVVSFNSMITGFAQNGYGNEAIMLFQEMQERSTKPNDITFLGVLSACAHMGLVQEGWKYFNYMKSFYKIEPSPDHYACMVDLLGRARLLDEAMNLIDSMTVQPHAGVWGALLGASKICTNLDLAKFAAQRLFELEPSSATPYVVLSDLYSVAGLKKDEEEVRLTKKVKGVRKNPGCSWITMKDKVNFFLSGDQSHLKFEDIKNTLWIMVDEMKQSDFQSNDLLLC